MTELDPLGLRRSVDAIGHEIPFTFEGRRLFGIEGEPIAAALHAQGVRIFGRSMKYHRPRGLHCLADACPNCSMRVNGFPGVATCSTPLATGDVVTRERGVPTAERDFLGAMDSVSRLTPVGFQYRRFRHSRRMFSVWERLLARLAGSGTLPEPREARALVEQSAWTTRDSDIVVIGGGVAGLAAALAAARSGARVLLVERRAELGGYAAMSAAGEDRARVGNLERLTRAESQLEVMTGATAIGWYAEDVLAVAAGTAMVEVRATGVVLATGSHERPRRFMDNDRPGVMLANGAERLLRQHGVRPGRRVAIATAEDSGYDIAAELLTDGIDVVGIADSRSSPVTGAGDSAETLRVNGVDLHSGATVVAALGRPTVSGVRIATRTGSSIDMECDALLVANGRRPARELLLQRAAAGGLALDVPDVLRDASVEPTRPIIDGWRLAGGAGGTETIDAAVETGETAGRAVAEGAT